MLAWLYIATEWLIRLGMVPIVIRRRQSSTALAWLAVIFFLPVVGLVLYLMVGTRRLGQRRALRYHAMLERVSTPNRAALLQPHIVHPEIDPRQRDLVHLAESIGDYPILGGNEVECLADTQLMIDRLTADISAAKHHVNLVYYIFQDDRTGREVAAALSSAAQRGVRCRVLVDAVGSAGMLRSLAPEMRASGVEVVPLLRVNPFRLFLARIDLRNHRKLAIIDGVTAYTGSQNIVNPDYGHKKAGMWQDLTVRLIGPVVQQLQLVFLEDWCSETNVVLETPDLFPQAASSPAGGVPVQIVPSGPTFETSSGIHDLFVAAIHEAERQIVITSPYLIPSETLITALRVAVLRGVQVDLVVPERSDQWLVDRAARAYFADLLAAGVRLHLHRDGLLHAKTLTVDSALALIGSTNFDTRSFELNFELTAMLYGREVTDLIRWSQQAYIRQSVPLDPATWNARPRLAVFLDNLSRLLGPLL